MQSTAFVDDFQVAVFQHAAERFAEKRQQDLVLQAGGGRVPFDIEEVGEVGAFAIFEHIEPPHVARVVDAHVVGHDVE